jgi:hypothetical protein
MDLNKLIERAKNILLTPKTEWPVIAGESATTGELYKNYVLILAAIPAIASFIGMTAIGVGIFRFGVGVALSAAVVGYLLSLVLVYVYGLVINALAPTFGGQKDAMQALKTAVYASTAGWVAGIGGLIPFLGWLIGIAGAVYTIYLLYLGLPKTMKCPEDKAVGYTAVSVIVGIVLSWIVSLVVGGITAGGMFGGMMRGAGPTVTLPGGGDVKIDPDSSLGKLEQWSKQVEEAGKKVETAEKSGSADATAEAVGGLLGAVLGGGAQAVESLPSDRMKSFLPDTLAGLPRKSMSAERNQAMGLQVSKANAEYGSADGPDLALEITDMGGARGVMLFAGWAGVESESQTDSRVEKTYKQGGRMVHEQWDSAANRGEFSMVVGERFIAKVAGAAPSLDALKSALGEVDLAALESLKNEGVKPN